MRRACKPEHDTSKTIPVKSERWKRKYYTSKAFPVKSERCSVKQEPSFEHSSTTANDAYHGEGVHEPAPFLSAQCGLVNMPNGTVAYRHNPELRRIMKRLKKDQKRADLLARDDAFIENWIRRSEEAVVESPHLGPYPGSEVNHTYDLGRQFTHSNHRPHENVDEDLRATFLRVKHCLRKMKTVKQQMMLRDTDRVMDEDPTSQW